MSKQIFKRNTLSAVLGATITGLVLVAAPVHGQNAAATSGADSKAGKDASGQMSKQGADSSSSGSSAQGSTASSSSGASGSEKSSGSSGAAAKISKSDREMMEKIAQANIAEIETGKLAEEKSKNDEVREFAKKMVDDHTKAQDELKEIAESKGVDLPTKPDAKHQAAIKKMNDLSEEQFNKRYMAQAGLSDHKSAHSLLQTVSKKAKDEDLKEYAGKTVESVDEHWKMAREMTSGKGAATSSGSSTGKPDGSASGSSGNSSEKPGSSGSK